MKKSSRCDLSHLDDMAMAELAAYHTKFDVDAWQMADWIQRNKGTLTKACNKICRNLPKSSRPDACKRDAVRAAIREMLGEGPIVMVRGLEEDPGLKIIAKNNPIGATQKELAKALVFRSFNSEEEANTAYKEDRDTETIFEAAKYHPRDVLASVNSVVGFGKGWGSGPVYERKNVKLRISKVFPRGTKISPLKE